jgi:hypothetical protein
MHSTVLFVGQAFQIGDVVVERVPVFMVNVMPFGDWSVVMFPNRLVKPSNAIIFALGANEVVAQFELRRVRITTIRDSVEDDAFGGWLQFDSDSRHTFSIPKIVKLPPAALFTSEVCVPSDMPK